MKKKNKPMLTPFGKNAENALKSAVRRVLLEHKRKGIPIATWEDGKIKIIPPRKIKVK